MRIGPVYLQRQSNKAATQTTTTMTKQHAIRFYAPDSGAEHRTTWTVDHMDTRFRPLYDRAKGAAEIWAKTVAAYGTPVKVYVSGKLVGTVTL
jgi:hypothetical protein